MDAVMYVFALLFVGLFIAMAVMLNLLDKGRTENQKTLQKKFEDLQSALRGAFAKAVKRGNSDARVIDMLIEASAHLAAHPSWTSTRRIITTSERMKRYNDGLALVSEAEKLIGS